MAEEVLKLVNDGTSSAVIKAAKFRSIGTKRVNQALKIIGRIGNLGNRSSYAYSDAEVQRLVSTLRTAIDRLEARFTSSSKDSEFSF